MSSNPAEAQAVLPPSPEMLQELIDALTSASRDVSETRLRVETEYAGHVERLSAGAARGLAKAQASVDAYKRELNEAVEDATLKLTELEARSANLKSKLSHDLTTVEAVRERVEADLSTISETIRQVRADRDIWDSQAQAMEARHETALQGLRRSLAVERTRIDELEAANKLLSDMNTSLEERLTTLEKKKVFGLF